MRTRVTWKVGLCLWSMVVTAGCRPVRPTPAPPGPVTPGDARSLGAACNDPNLRWARDNKARYHETIEGARLKLVPERGNFRTEAKDMEVGRVLALLVVQSGSVDFAAGPVSAPDSICIFLQGVYPTGTSPGNLRSTFVRKRDPLALENVGTYVRIATPHRQAEVDWVVDYDSPEKGGMLPFPPSASKGEKIRMQTQTACPGGSCCSPKKPV